MAEHTIMLTDLYLQLIAAIISYCFPFFVSFCLTEIEKGNLSVGLLMDRLSPVVSGYLDSRILISVIVCTSNNLFAFSFTQSYKYIYRHL